MRRFMGHRSYGSARKRPPGPHMIVTEAQTLDEAVDIIRSRQKHPPSPTPRTLGQQLSSNDQRQRMKDITLPLGMKSDALANRSRPPRSSVIHKQAWTREEVLELYRTTKHTLKVLAKISSVPGHQIRQWMYEEGLWLPQDLLTAQKEVSILTARLLNQQEHLRDLKKYLPGRKRAIFHKTNQVEATKKGLREAKAKLKRARAKI